ncbi:TonB-dependent receptor [Pedobacter sp. SYSU D00535]|uniref:TonB-dependent receptor n=1 Tax=Pedobacter sp. SYSU D00535 TaxID=2810308 RepID=UPI001A96F805|nr:TonB-dependent receptor [Pedobacter sp. SYSU D00535]
MKQKIPFLTLLLSVVLLNFSSLFAQSTGTIRGSISTPDGKPAEKISVMLKGKGRGTATNTAGEYSFNELRPGAYMVRVTAVGSLAQEKTVELGAGETIVADFVLSADAARLQEVTISSQKVNTLHTRKSESVARLPLENLENPQVYTTINKELMQLQMTINFNDALKNSSGIDKLWSSTGRAGDGAAYYNLRGFATQASMVNGIAGLTNGDLDPANIEKIEVIKGPSGTLFGGALTNFGGLINIVTKRPLDTLGGELSYTTGSFDLNRLSGDIYGPVSKDGKLTGRLNTAYNYRNSFQDAGFSRSFFVAPALEYKVSDRLRLNLDAQFYNYEGTNPLMVFLNRSRQLIARTPAELNFNFERSYTSNDVTFQTPTSNIFGQITYKLSDSWTSQTSFSRSNRQSNGLYQYVMFIGATDDLLNRYVADQNSISTSGNFQQNFTGDFQIAGLRNRLVAGFDALRLETRNNNSPYILFDQVNSVQADDANYGKLNEAAVEAKLAASTAAFTKNTLLNNVYGAYVSNVLNITPELMAMLSVRVDRFDNRGTFNQSNGSTTGKYLQTAWSPKLGLVYQVVKDKVALFGNYMNGFKNVAPVTQPLPDYSGTFKPQHANQLEGGVKLDIFRNKLSLTASYYDITVSNMTRAETITVNGTPYNVTIQDGTQTSKGFETDVVSNPLKGLNIVAGYSYNDSKMTKAAAGVQGRRPVTAGPAHLVNAWISYSIQQRALKGLGFGFGGNYASENLITNSAATGVFSIPAYTVLNATAFYNARLYRISLKVDNISNETYYKGWTTVEPQLPRSVLAGIAFKL